MGSTTHIVDEAGAIQNWYEYDAWGNITAKQEAIPNRYTYYGQQLDPITQPDSITRSLVALPKRTPIEAMG